MLDSPKGGELDPAIDDKKNSSVLSYIGKRQKKAVVAGKSGQFTAGEVGKVHFF